MNKGKTGIVLYIEILAAALVVAAGLLFGAGKLAVVITDRANAYYRPFYEEGDKGFSSPWYSNGLHIVDEGFVNELSAMKKQEHNIVVLGSSLSIIPLLQEEVLLDEDYQYAFFVCGNGSYTSDRIMKNLLDTVDAWHEADIAKYEVSFSTFRDTKTTITETTLDKWGKYSVDDACNVRENAAVLAPAYWINLQLLKIQNVWELAGSYLQQDEEMLETGKSVRAAGNFKNNYFNYDFVASTCEITDEMQQIVLSDIGSLSLEHATVVELSPFPDGLAQTEYGKEYMKYVDSTLIPYLQEQGIPYFDYRTDYRDEEYADGVHLSYQAAVRYTRQLNQDLNHLIDENQK